MPVEPAVREVALGLYRQVAELPLISPHGHVDAAVLADDRAYADPVELLVRPDHYVLRLLHAHGASYADLGFRAPGETGPVAEPREVWRRLCRYWPVFRGTVMRLWLEDELASLFAITEPLTEGTADETYDHITAELGSDQFRPGRYTGASASKSWPRPTRPWPPCPPTRSFATTRPGKAGSSPPSGPTW